MNRNRKLAFCCRNDFMFSLIVLLILLLCALKYLLRFRCSVLYALSVFRFDDVIRLAVYPEVNHKEDPDTGGEDQADRRKGQENED